ncbi:YdeI/OmpD-associated family protein [Halobacillus sp. Nhm2S1]|uniref:YdeI/OmpD-associated family protein n=1 Tax=Halobacillus sp. Nhm2S1 TaxID=2866716 RepID=UPI001C72EC93|nr:YdeI/OmpD-associated family protein [Halobacillus sp. Nhm2S1]MBX0356827.1 YdeI/OmpD-associated family protein [Halobacillus sp. Nhm2S1]
MATIKDKLKLSKYKNLAVLHQPEDYDLFDEESSTLSEHHDAVFIFVKNLEDMKTNLQTFLQRKEVLTEQGYIFFAYPKKGNTRYDTYIHRDDMFPALRIGEDKYIEDSDIKFSRMVSMDEVFTVIGMKREKKKAQKTTPASQCVADYEDKVEEVDQLLEDHPAEQEFYRSLTPGYKRDWARQIFSAKQQSTRDKRTNQMIEVLSKGYKSLDLYRRKKK